MFVCVHRRQLIRRGLLISPGTSERWYIARCFVPGGARWSRPFPSPALLDCRGPSMWVRSRGERHISSPGQMGVNEHFNHPAKCQSLLGVIVTAFPEINTEKPGWGDNAHASRAADSHLMRVLALRESTSEPLFGLAASLAHLGAVTICHQLTKEISGRFFATLKVKSVFFLSPAVSHYCHTGF